MEFRPTFSYHPVFHSRIEVAPLVLENRLLRQGVGIQLLLNRQDRVLVRPLRGGALGDVDVPPRLEQLLVFLNGSLKVNLSGVGG